MQKERLSKRSKLSWFIARSIWTVIISLILLLSRGIIVNEIFGEVNSSLVNLGIGLFILVLILDTVLYPIIEYNQWQYTITEDKVEFTEGIFFKKTTLIPIIRIQHVEVREGPINRILKLSDVVIHTAGGEHKIPNLEMEKAKEIINSLNSKVKNKFQKNLEKEEDDV